MTPSKDPGPYIASWRQSHYRPFHHSSVSGVGLPRERLLGSGKTS